MNVIISAILALIRGIMIEVQHIFDLHKNTILRWKKQDHQLCEQDFYQFVEENHHFNYQLWHAEDEARREDKGFEYVYQAKRAIDGFNQKRNDRMEMMDMWIFENFNPAHHESCPVHSETPGMMIDRLSILALKAYHMHAQTIREDVDTTHIQNCMQKLDIIHAQQQQLTHCLSDLLNEISNKTRTFRVYRQFKMYNDKTLNPALYKQAD